MTRKKRFVMERHRQPVKNIIGMPADQYVIGSWCASPDATGKPTAVSVQLEADGHVGMFARMDTPEEVDELVAALRWHQSHVWPESVN